jgi:hypothetical protein
MIAVIWRHREVSPGWRLLALVEVAGAVLTDIAVLYECYFGQRGPGSQKVEEKVSLS